MSQTFSVEISYHDGTSEVVPMCEVLKDDQGSLRLYRYRSFSGGREHLGSWPLASIRKWKILDE